MQTVNFQCGNCNNLMAVSAEYIGQQVRCPHCQAVVVAPAAAASAPAAPAPATAPFTMPTLNEQDDIFAPPPPTDDLFGGPEAPRIELPPAPVPQPPPTIAQNGAPDPAAAAGAPVGATLTYSGPPPAAPPGDATIPSWMDAPAASAPAPGAATETNAPAPVETFQPVVRKPRDGGGWFIGLVFIPLVSYSVLVTILAVYLFNRVGRDATPAATQPGPTPLENLPSFDPTDPNHDTHLKNQGKLNWINNIDRATATAELPPNQITQLGKKLRLGDLEIEPLRVDREIVKVKVGEWNPEPCPHPSLVLTLKLHNVSDNVVFQPMDPFFDRKWEPKGGAAPPLTILELTGKDPANRFLFGGPAEYHKPSKGASDFVVRAKDADDPPTNKTEQVLSPGEEKEFFVCTDGGLKAGDKGKDAFEAFDGYHGKLLWRIHLRRGVVVLDEHHYVPVSTVVGVEFTDADYRKEG